MGKATLDLPELEAEAPAAAAGTDDLLAQLAGQEIDRLLAAADVERPPASAGPSPSISPSQAATQSSVEPPASREEPLLAPPGEPHERLLPDLDAPRAEQAIGDLVAPLDPELEEATREISASAERLGLDLALGPAAAQLAAEDADNDFGDEQSEMPLILRPLAWLDACCQAIPKGLLETAGKIGILTTINAMAVLIYVLFFRHH